MKMTNYFICCEQCFEEIGKVNTRAAKLWMDLCTLHMEKGGSFCLGLYMQNDELMILENLCFLVSSENSELGIGVQMKGYIEDYEGQPCFCKKEGRHE